MKRQIIDSLNFAKLILQHFWIPIGCVCMILALASVGLAYIARCIADIVSVLRDGGDIYFALVKFITVDMLLTLLFLIQMLINRSYRPKLYEFIMVYLTNHILHKDKKYFQENSSGGILYAISQLSRMVGSLIRMVPWFLFVIGTIFSSIYMCFQSHRYIGMILSAWVVVYFLINVYFGIQGGKHSIAFTKQVINISGSVTDMCDNIHYINSTYYQKHEIELLTNKMIGVKHEYYNVETTFGWAAFVQNITFGFADLLIYAVCAHLFASGEIAIAQVAEYTVLAAAMHHILYSTPRDVGDFVENLATYYECIDLIGDSVEIHERLNPIVGPGAIEIKNLTVPGLFKGLNMSIAARPGAGQTIGLVGRSGVGKTTLINMLLRDSHLEYTGQILVNNTDIETVGVQDLRDIFAVVPQSIRLFRRSVRDNIAYGIEATDKEVQKAARNALIDDVIMALPKGYETIVGEDCRFSGGQEQRIILARAFLRLKTAKILLIDEGTSALDNTTEEQISQAISSLITTNSITTIVIAHRLSTLKECDCIFEIDNRKANKITYEEVINKSVNLLS